MIALAADENFNNDILRGLMRLRPGLDIVRIQDVGLSGADDPVVLEWAAREGRVLLRHDVSTITLSSDKADPRPLRNNGHTSAAGLCEILALRCIKPDTDRIRSQDTDPHRPTRIFRRD
jgi:hypothetical protein